jgi:hypothetical protein
MLPTFSATLTAPFRFEQSAAVLLRLGRRRSPAGVSSFEAGGTAGAPSRSCAPLAGARVETAREQPPVRRLQPWWSSVLIPPASNVPSDSEF